MEYLDLVQSLQDLGCAAVLAAVVYLFVTKKPK